MSPCIACSPAIPQVLFQRPRIIVRASLLCMQQAALHAQARRVGVLMLHQCCVVACVAFDDLATLWAADGDGVALLVPHVRCRLLVAAGRLNKNFLHLITVRCLHSHPAASASTRRLLHFVAFDSMFAVKALAPYTARVCPRRRLKLRAPALHSTMRVCHCRLFFSGI